MGRMLLSLWTWFEIALCAVAGFLTQLILAPVAPPFDRRRIIIGRCFRLAGVTATRLTLFWRFGVYGDVPRRIDGRTVFVSNHESQADPFLISFLPWEIKWLVQPEASSHPFAASSQANLPPISCTRVNKLLVRLIRGKSCQRPQQMGQDFPRGVLGKASLFRIPIAGWSMALAGDIPIHRGEGRSAKEAMDRCKQWLERGVPVIFFPEGTRSPDGKMGPFKDGAFRLALDSGAQIIPSAVCGTRKALPQAFVEIRLHPRPRSGRHAHSHQRARGERPGGHQGRGPGADRGTASTDAPAHQCRGVSE